MSIMATAELSRDQREELYHDLVADRARLEATLRLTKEGSKPVQLSTPIGRLSRMDAMGLGIQHPDDAIPTGPVVELQLE